MTQPTPWSEHTRGPCPHCGHPVPAGVTDCPSCGASLTGAWPPPPADRGNGPAPRPPNDTGAWMGFFMGLALGAGWWYVGASVVYGMSYGRSLRPLLLVDALLFGPPAAFSAVAGLLLRRGRPKFARGLGFSAVAILALSLGAVAVCH